VAVTTESRSRADEETRHDTTSCLVISSQDINTKDHLGLLRLDAKNDELVSRQSLFETSLIELVFMLSETQQALTLVSDPLPRTLAPEPWQITLEGFQCSLAKISLLLHGHICLPQHLQGRSDGAFQFN
jgi:hypothetical protein